MKSNAAEADIIIDGIADGTNLSSLTLSATGLNASIDINGAIGSGTEASRIGENDIHQCSSAGSTCAMRTLN